MCDQGEKNNPGGQLETIQTDKTVDAPTANKAWIFSRTRGREHEISGRNVAPTSRKSKSASLGCKRACADTTRARYSCNCCRRTLHSHSEGSKRPMDKRLGGRCKKLHSRRRTLSNARNSEKRRCTCQECSPNHTQMLYSTCFLSSLLTAISYPVTRTIKPVFSDLGERDMKQTRPRRKIIKTLLLMVASTVCLCEYECTGICVR